MSERTNKQAARQRRQESNIRKRISYHPEDWVCFACTNLLVGVLGIIGRRSLGGEEDVGHR